MATVDIMRRLRVQKGLTMKELGERVGVTEAAISNYERGIRKPDYETLLKISDELDCEAMDILSEMVRNEETELRYSVGKVARELEKALPKFEAFQFVNLYDMLNADGKELVISFMNSLIENPKYSSKNNADSSGVSA